MSEYGYCQCGCGRQTEIAEQSHTKRGWVKGEPKRFVLGHGYRKYPHGWDVRDEGYSSPCWNWRGSKTPGGYPKRGTVSVYREMWEQEHGPVPPGLELDHLCRNHACVNPAHLEPVTHAENIRRGKTAKITAAIAAEIREAPGTLTALGKEYGLHPTTIMDIKRGSSWT